ncbi:MAG: ATP-binding protein [Bacteroidota bacterium]
MGYATSRDGILWTKHSANPVLTPNPKSWDSGEALFGYVIVIGSKHQMWYTGGDRKTYRRIGYAQSSDGILWTKSGKPVLGNDSSPAESVPLTCPSVMGPDSAGGYKMWFNTRFDTDLESSEIGFATGANAVSWVVRPEPVLTPHKAEFGEIRELRIPRVICNNGVYEMWYSGSTSNVGIWRMEYATSTDDIHWKRHLENPVLHAGSSGSWDDFGVWPGDIDFERNMYYMWYVGSGSVAIVRTGFAVSPKGMSVSFTPSQSNFRGGISPIRLAVRVPEADGLTFLANILASDEEQEKRQNVLSGFKKVGKTELFDDGMHADSLAGDGLFANIWNALEGELYIVDLEMKMRKKAILGFEMKNAGAFTTIGPVKVDSVVLEGGARPTPGATVVLKLILRNVGFPSEARSVTASLSAADSWVSNVSSSSSSYYGHVLAGTRALTTGSYNLVISPDCPPNTDVHVNVDISSLGISLWRDSFSLHVYAPWWRTDWAYILYAAIGLVGLLVLRRLEVRRTRRKHILEMEHFQTEKLKELDQLKSRFFANISHEFRTPLTLIEGPLKQLKSGELKGNPEEQYDMMLRNTRRLTRLVNQLLDLSKIESGDMKVRGRKLDIAELVRGVAAAFESLAKRKQIEFRVKSSEESIIGWFDGDAVEKIVTNLLSNALKFTTEDGRVTLDVSRNGIPTSVDITVTDTGIGIPSDQLSRVFDRFYQVDASQVREQEGSGIGLALAKELVDLHKGEITVTSEPGRGSTFTVRLPLGKEHLKPEEIVEADERGKPREVKTGIREPEKMESQDVEGKEGLPLLLIVEDNADMQKYMRTHLEGAYNLFEAVNGEEGLLKASEVIPDLVISDVMMPKMDGFEFTRRIKTDEKTSHIPVILLTAKASAEHKLEGLETGADDYLVKPFDAKELLVRVKNLIEQRRKLRDRFQREITLQPHDIPITSMEEQFLSRAKEIVHNHLSDPNLGVELFAEEMALSRSQLHRKLYALTGVSPGEFIRSMRLQRAAVLLQKHFGNISQVAYEVGFSNPSHFTESFRKQFGVAPSEYSGLHS